MNEPVTPVHGAHGSADRDHDHAHHGPTPTQRLFGLLRGGGHDLWVVLVYAIGVGLLSLVVPIATASLVNTVSFGTLLQPLVVLTFLVFVGLSFEGVMRALQFWVVEMLQRRVFVQVALDLARRLPRVRVAAFDRAHGPELVNRFFDVLTVQKAAATLLLDGLAVLLQALIGTLLLAFYHPLLLAFDLVLVLAILVILFPLGRGAIDTSIQESKAKYAVAAWLEEIARLTNTFRGDGATRFAEERADALAQNYLRARTAHFVIVLRQHIGSLGFKVVLSSTLLGVGGWLVLQRGLTIGQLAASELVLSAVVAGMAKFAKQLESWYDLVTAADKLGHLTDLPLDRTDGHPVPEAQRRGARLEFRNVSFAHDARPVLHGVSLCLNAGERAAVLGRSGSGKSSLADLAVGRRAPSSGTLHLEGADLRELSLDAVRGTVALVRDVEIFDGTVAENVALGRPGVTPERVRRVLAALHLDEAIAELRDGVNTVLSPTGSPLSATQAQVLMFARALAAEPRLVIVDGALDALDSEGARDIMTALTAPDAPWALLVLTHRAEVAARCPTTYRLQGAALARVEV